MLPRREFCRLGFAAAAAAGRARGTITRSSDSLTIGLDPESGRAFIEERVPGETWVWNWREVRAADLKSASGNTRNWKPVAPVGIDETPAGFRLRYEEAWGRFSGSVELAGAEVLFRVEPDLRYPCELGGIQFPSTLRPEGDSRPVLLDTLFGGRMHRLSTQVPQFRMDADRSWMRYYGAIGARSAYLAILEPGFDALLTCADGGKAPDYGWVHTPRMGNLHQNRTQRFRFVSSPSYVVVARAYRRYAMEQGFYRSLEEKIEECPSLRKLFGAALVMIGYLRDPEADYAAAFRRLKERGIEKAYVYPTGYFNFNGGDEVYPGYRSDYRWIELKPEDFAELRRLDYLSAPWVWLNEVVSGSPYVEQFTLRRADGSKSANWRVGKVQWYSSHEGRVLEMLRQAAPELRKKYTAAHFDVLNAGPCEENYGSWPYDRKAGSGYRTGMFAEFSAHDRVVGCEQNKDWAIPYKHFGTAKLAGPYGKDAPFRPVPLWQLAFHDAVMTSWWEHSTYNDPDLGHDLTGREIRRRMLLDILTGDLPSVCPAGRMVGWKNPGGADREMFDYRYKLDDPVTVKAIDAAAEVARFNARHATDDLTHHQFLSEDGMEQESAYASGTRVKIRLPRERDDPGELRIT
ncbi:MAG: hypothetical protein KIT09_33745 [Bryobacteraceae bacterium]|nr:hypothetical protein [Bryobacteraceae bacterium]